MTQKQLLSFLGAGFLALGTFMPVVNVPFLGSINAGLEDYGQSGGEVDLWIGVVT